MNVEFYPQHRDKCYCRKPCLCSGIQEKFNKTNFIKRKSRLIKEKLPLHNNETNNSVTEFEKTTTGLSYTLQRQNYEMQTQYQEMEASEENYNDSYERKQLPFSSQYLQYDDRIHEISDFRKHNSSECISVTNQHSQTRLRRNYISPTEDHICSHRYILNDRNLPVPESSNAQGQSVCFKCKRPYTEDPLSVKNCRVTHETCADKIELKPSEPILILEVQLDKKNNNRTNCTVKNANLLASQRSKIDLTPTNSFALRYQKHK